MQIKYYVFNIQRRLLTIILLVAFIFLTLSVRLFVVQIINGNHLMTMASSQWERTLPITAQRGTIYDRNGIELAVSYTTYNVYVRASNITDSVAVARVLNEVLGVDFAKTLEKVKDRSVSESLIKMQVEKQDVSKLYKYQFDGLYFAENNKRYYPYNDYLTQVLGYTTIDNVGQSGLENYYNNYLSGIDGYTLTEGDVRGKEIGVNTTKYKPGIAGMDIDLTIDIGLQAIIESQLNKILTEQKAKSVNILLMQPKTGEILAMASAPNFDLNNVPRDDISTLMETSKNMNITDIYEPGSTFKILTMGMALDSGKAKLSDTFYDPGYRIVDGQKIRCWKSVGHGHETLSEGLCNSCNSVFMDLALRLGKDMFYDYLDKFGFGEQTGIDFYGESSGLLMNKDSVKNVDLARMGFGQAVAVTPLQQVTAVSSALNGGSLMKPYFVKSVQTKDNVLVSSNSPTKIRQVISSDVSAKLRVMLEEVVSFVTGKYTFVPGYAVSGKTGTTQKYENGKISGKYISSFIGTYPASDPDYVLLVSVDEPGNGAFYGSIVASPYAKEIFKDIFKYKNILPDAEGIELGMVEMPYLVNTSLSDAIIKLKNLKLQYEIDGTGGIVLEQFPPAGEELVEGATVLLKT